MQPPTEKAAELGLSFITEFLTFWEPPGPEEPL